MFFCLLLIRSLLRRSRGGPLYLQQMVCQTAKFLEKYDIVAEVNSNDIKSNVLVSSVKSMQFIIIIDINFLFDNT